MPTPPRRPDPWPASVALIAAACILAATLPSPASAGVRFGVDVLRDDGFAALRGKRVGLVAHPASVDANLTHTADLLRDADGVTLVALFGPEHGVRGDARAGDDVADAADPATGLPVHSLYGKTRRPTPAMLAGLDALVFDLQDVGARSYTYASTLRLCLEACAENGVALVVLDRPNPLGGNRVEGPALDPAFASFVGLVPTPYLHGLTTGELARLLRDEITPAFEKLTVVPMDGWRRDMTWRDLGREWVPTSPHAPTPQACAAYAATGLLGELGVVSNGVGYPLPFGIVGAPGVDAETLASAARSTYGAGGAPAGVAFRPAHFTPFYATFAGESCAGVQVHLDPATAANLTEVNVRLLVALGGADVLARADRPRRATFDKAFGTDAPRRHVEAGRPIDELFADWRRQSAAFEARRRPYLLY